MDARSFGWVAVVLAGCAQAPTPTAGPASTHPVVPPLYAELEVDHAPEADPKPQERVEPALPQAMAALEGAGLTHAWFGKDGAARATEHGLTSSIAIAALDEIAEVCPDSKAPPCEARPGALKTKAKLIQWLGFAGDERSGGVLFRLKSGGLFGASIALDNMLARRAEARAVACAPPATDAVAEVRASLSDFAVFDQQGKGLVARPLTTAESADLAYFLVAVEQAETPVGTDDNSFDSGSKPSEQFSLERDANYATLEQAGAAADTEEIIRSGVAYLESLGYPGKIDRSLEGNMRWGGGRYSYVMRDVALAAELAGDFTLSSALYRRANPGGGACGTSVSSRRGAQLKGLIRSADAGGNCNEVVAERLLDWDGDDDSFFGPDRLAAAGFDIERIYRGAFLTRHRDLPEAELFAALDRAPEAFAAAARARVESKGSEAWDARIWAIEGLADTLGREGGFYLAATLPQLAPSAKRRALDAIGAAGRRMQVGPCEGQGFIGFGSTSSQWTRPVAAFGKSCQSSYSDDDVKTLYRSFRSNMRSVSADVRIATVGAASALGALTALGDIRKLHARHRRAAKACKPGDQGQCYAQENAVRSTSQALKTLREHQAELRARTK